MSEWDDAVGADSASMPPWDAGRVLAGRYRLDEQLAERGTTRTWRALDTKLSREVLIHLLPTDDPRVDHALDSARKAATVNDSRFLRVLDALPAADAAGEVESLIVCEFMPGKSLEQLLAEGPLSGLEAAWIVRELAEALTAQHALGNFHERLDPDTVVITPTGSVKIVGFLIDAALHPEEGRTPTWSERESSDVRALGKILYACLVSEWPLEPGSADHDFGLPHAQLDSHGWITPRQAKAGVVPLLDGIADRLLSIVPRNNEQPIRTASQLTLALSKALGSADASPDLERRLHQSRTASETRQVRPDTRGAIAAAHEAIARGTAATEQAAATTALMPAQSDASTRADGARPSTADRTTGSTAAWDADATAPFTPVPPPRPAQTPSSAPPLVTPDSPVVTPAVDGGSPTVNVGTARLAPPPARRLAIPHPSTRSRRWLPLLAVIIAVAIFFGVVQAFKNKSSDTSANNGDPVKVAHAISGADDFDPETDGGNDQENPNELVLAFDKNPKTAWSTVTYLNRAKMGGLKPGVGVVFDLGRPVEVGKVTLTMIGTPTAIELRVPKADASPAPMSSINRWTKVASQATSPATAVLTPEAPVTTRFLLVYLTSLPNVGGNKYQGAIAEIEVTP